MKAKKLTGLLLAGALFTGVAGMGTYAFFSDTVESKANLTIAMGNLNITDITEEDDKLWTVQISEDANANTEVYEQGEFNPTDNFSNVRPGDVFTRKIVLENQGSLKQKVNVTFNEKIQDVVVGHAGETPIKFSDVFELVTPDLSEVVLTPDKDAVGNEDRIEIPLSFTVKASMDNTFNKKNSGIARFNLNKLLDGASFVTVTATQVNN